MPSVRSIPTHIAAIAIALAFPVAARAQAGSELPITLTCEAIGSGNPPLPQSSATIDCGTTGCRCDLHWANQSGRHLGSVVVRIVDEGAGDVPLVVGVDYPDGNLVQVLDPTWPGILGPGVAKTFGLVDPLWANTSSHSTIGRYPLPPWLGSTAFLPPSTPLASTWQTATTPLPAGIPWANPVSEIAITVPCIQNGVTGKLSLDLGTARRAQATTGRLAAYVVSAKQASVAGATKYELTTATAFNGEATSAMQGSGVLPVPEMVVYLPYWKAATQTIVADASFSLDPSNRPVFAAATLAASGRTEGSGGTSLTVTMSAGSGADSYPINTGAVVEHDLANNAVRYRGATLAATNWSQALAYSANIDDAGLAGTSVGGVATATWLRTNNQQWAQGRFCARDANGVVPEACVGGQFRMSGLPPLGTTGFVHYFRSPSPVYPSSLINDGGERYAEHELRAIRPDREVRHEIRLLRTALQLYTDRTEIRNLELIDQVGGAGAPAVALRNITVTSTDVAFYNLPETVAGAIYVMFTPTSAPLPDGWGHAADLRGRSLPAGDHPDWVLCKAFTPASVALDPKSVCATADLLAGRTMSEVQFFRIAFPSVPDGARGGVSVTAEGVLAATTPTSVDGNGDSAAEISNTSLAVAAFGATARLMLEAHDGTQWVALGADTPVEISNVAEYDGLPSSALKQTLGLRYLDTPGTYGGGVPRTTITNEGQTANATIDLVRGTILDCWLENIGETALHLPATIAWRFDQAPSFVLPGTVPASGLPVWIQPLLVRSRNSGLETTTTPDVSAYTFTTTWDPGSRRLAVTIDRPSDPTWPGPVLELDALTYVDTGLRLALAGGQFPPESLAGAKSGCEIVATYDHRDERLADDPSDPRTLARTGLIQYTFRNPTPALQLAVAASRPLVPLGETVDLALSLSNRAYTDAGALRPGGSRGPAYATVMSFKVPTASDCGVEPGGVGDLVAMRSADAESLWVFSGDPYAASGDPDSIGNAGTLDDFGWKRCARRSGPGEIGCAVVGGNLTAWSVDAAGNDIAPFVIAQADVDFVVLVTGTALITDAPPRATVAGADVPYAGTVTLAPSAASADETYLCGPAEVGSTSTLSPATAATVVEIDAACASLDCDDASLCTADSCYDGVCDNTLAVVCSGGDACGVEACDPADGVCKITPVGCDVRVFYGVVVAGDGTLGSIRCAQASPSAKPVCDAAGGVLVVGPPMCE